MRGQGTDSGRGAVSAIGETTVSGGRPGEPCAKRIAFRLWRGDPEPGDDRTDGRGEWRRWADYCHV